MDRIKVVLAVGFCINAPRAALYNITLSESFKCDIAHDIELKPDLMIASCRPFATVLAEVRTMLSIQPFRVDF
jgi:hypothetical protein